MSMSTCTTVRIPNSVHRPTIQIFIAHIATYRHLISEEGVIATGNLQRIVQLLDSIEYLWCVCNYSIILSSRKLHKKITAVFVKKMNKNA